MKTATPRSSQGTGVTDGTYLPLRASDQGGLVAFGLRLEGLGNCSLRGEIVQKLGSSTA